MRIERIILFDSKESVMADIGMWVDNPMVNRRKFNVVVLRDTPITGYTTVAIICSSVFYREYINTKRMILDG